MPGQALPRELDSPEQLAVPATRTGAVPGDA
jgi:hypothetical protein